MLSAKGDRGRGLKHVGGGRQAAMSTNQPCGFANAARDSNRLGAAWAQYLFAVGNAAEGGMRLGTGMDGGDHGIYPRVGGYWCAHVTMRLRHGSNPR